MQRIPKCSQTFGVYRLDYLGEGQPIDFRIHDNSPGDNSGYLEVEITPTNGPIAYWSFDNQSDPYHDDSGLQE